LPPLRAAMNAKIPTKRNPDTKSQAELLERLQPYVRRGLYELCFWRYGNDDLADSDDGRAMVIALLRFGIPDADAIRLAPWLTDSELRACKRKAMYMKWADVGPLIKLTDVEREGSGQKKLRHLKPYDISAEDLNKRSADRANEKAAKRAKVHRDKLRNERNAMLKTDERCKAVRLMLDSIHDGKDFKGPGCPPPYCYEVPLPALVELAKKSEAFAGVSPRSLRVTVHQIVKKLRALRMVKTKLKPGKCGPVLWVQNRRNAVIAQKHQNPVAAQGFLAEKTTVTVSTIVVEVTPPSLPNLAPNPELASGTKTNAGFNIIPCPNRRFGLSPPLRRQHGW
jgi:hypothetical protein